MNDSQKLDLLLDKVLYIEGNMVTRDELDTKLLHLGRHLESSILEQVDKKLLHLENSLLEEIDLIQEKANDHFVRVEKEVESIKGTVRTINTDHSDIRRMIIHVSQLQIDVGELEDQMSRIS